MCLFIILFFKDFFFNVDHFKVFIEFGSTLLLSHVLAFWPRTMWNLSSLIRNGADAPTLEGKVLTTGPPGKCLFLYFYNTSERLETALHLWEKRPSEIKSLLCKRQLLAVPLRPKGDSFPWKEQWLRLGIDSLHPWELSSQAESWREITQSKS